MRIEIIIDTDGAQTTVTHEFGLEIDTVARNVAGDVIARVETPDLARTAARVARRAAEIHRLTL